MSQNTNYINHSPSNASRLPAGKQIIVGVACCHGGSADTWSKGLLTLLETIMKLIIILTNNPLGKSGILYFLWRKSPLR